MAEPPNAFRAEVFAAAEHLDAPTILPISEFAGPWEVVFTPNGWESRKDGWESRKDGWTVRNLVGGSVAVIAQNFETAALIASILPLESRPPAYDVSHSAGRGHEVHTKVMGGMHEAVARLSICEPEGFDYAIETAYQLAGCPRSLAWVLAAASTDTLTRAGELLMEILEKRTEAQREAGRRRYGS